MIRYLQHTAAIVIAISLAAANLGMVATVPLAQPGNSVVATA